MDQAFWMVASAVGLLVIVVAVAYSHGESDGAARAEKRLADVEAARLGALGALLLTALAKHARQQRRLRGTLAEARRWKDVAVACGWKRPTKARAAVNTPAPPIVKPA